MELSEDRKEKLKSISEMIFSYSELLKESEGESMVNSPIIDNIIIACLKHKHASGVNPKDALSIIQKHIIQK